MARQAGVSHHAISLLTKELSDLGYVGRGPDPADLRVQVSGVEQGGAAARQTEHWFAEHELAWRSSMDDQAVDEAIATLALITRQEAQR